MSEDCLRDSFDEEHLQEYLKRVANFLGISNPKYSIKLGSKRGDNYTSVIYRVFITGIRNEVPVEVQTIFKVPPKDEDSRKALDIDYLFPREDYFYMKLVPIFKELLDSRNMKLENIATCYFSSIVDHKEAISFEDLGTKGFAMRDRLKQLDFPHISLALRALGRLHALSFALRDQKPEVFKSKITTLDEVAFRPEYMTSASVINIYEALGNLVKTALAEEDPTYMERFSNYFKDILSHAAQSCDGKRAEPYSVLCHGDFWMNNMLFNYDKDCMEPSEIYLLDFQFSRCSSPAVDLSFALFTSCSQELREKHYDELIKIYHESLSNYLIKLGSDPTKLFPYEALLHQLDNFSHSGAAMALMAIPLLVSQGDDIPNVLFDENDLSRLDERIMRDSFLKTTLRDTYKDLMDRNYM